MCDPIAMEHTGGALDSAEAEELLRVYVAGGGDDVLAVYAVEHRGQVIGSADVLRFADGSLEIGYAIVPTHWRRGLGARAARLILDVAKRMARRGQRIVALVDHGHDASIGVLSRVGMVPAGTHDDPDDGEVLLYALPADALAVEAQHPQPLAAEAPAE